MCRASIYLQVIIFALSVLNLSGEQVQPDAKKKDILENLINCVENDQETTQNNAKPSEGRSNCLELCIKQLKENMTQHGIVLEKEISEKLSKEAMLEDAHLKPAIIACIKDRNAEGVDNCKSTKRLLDCLKQKVDCPNKSNCIMKILFTVNGA